MHRCRFVQSVRNLSRISEGEKIPDRRAWAEFAEWYRINIAFSNRAISYVGARDRSVLNIDALNRLVFNLRTAHTVAGLEVQTRETPVLDIGARELLFFMRCYISSGYGTIPDLVGRDSSAFDP